MGMSENTTVTEGQRLWHAALDREDDDGHICEGRIVIEKSSE